MVKTKEMEFEADELASELILPTPEFRVDMRSLAFDELVAQYVHTSWEVVARKWILLNPAVLTIFDNKKLTRRLGTPGYLFPPQPTKPEIELAMRCYATGFHDQLDSDDLKISGYYVDEGMEVVRVILLTEFPTLDS